MSFAKKILSRFFGSAEENAKIQNEAQPQSTPDLQEKDLPDTEASASILPLEPNPTHILLPDDHALHELWHLYAHQAAEPCHIQLEMLPSGYAELPLSQDELASEASAFRLMLDRTAQKRMWMVSMAAGADTVPDLDAQINVHLSQDQMAAWIIIYPPIGQGQDLSKELLTQTLKQLKVIFGLDAELLESLLTLKNRYFCILPIARGTYPIDGIDGEVIDHFPRTVQHEVMVNEFNQVDYTSLNLVHNVAKGDVICDIKSETPGVDGKTVTGSVLAAHNGVKPSIPQGRNTVLSEDGTQLLADCTGHVEFSVRSFQVRTVLEIPGDVDYAVGNINFLGDVHVKGDITSGFTVRAAGNIQVDGVVEAATVEAGGNLVVACGVTGQDRAIIRAHQCIYAKYLENCCAYARQGIQTDCIINCNIYSDADIVVRSGRGKIIGGTLRASQEISATTVGSKNETATVIILGGLPCEAFEREQILAELAQIEASLAKLEPKPDSPSKKTQLSEQRLKLYVAKMKLKKFDQDFETISAQFEEADSRRLICTTIHPGTTITIDTQSRQIEHLEHNCIIHLSRGSIDLI